MNDLTDKEAATLDEYYTTHVPKVGPNEGGFFANRTRHLIPVDDLSAAYIRPPLSTAALEADYKAVGTEIQKTRPAVIVSNDLANQHLGRVTVMPLTSNTLA